MHAVLAVLRHWFSFAGRARRREFWLFWFVTNAIGGTLSQVDRPDDSGADVPPDVGNDDSGWGIDTSHATFGLHGSYLPAIFGLLTLVPMLAVTCRRLHDLGVTGRWLLLVLTVPAFGVLGAISGRGEIFLLSFVGPLILGVMALFAGQHGPNRFGPDPLAPTRTPEEPDRLLDTPSSAV